MAKQILHIFSVIVGIVNNEASKFPDLNEQLFNFIKQQWFDWLSNVFKSTDKLNRNGTFYAFTVYNVIFTSNGRREHFT